MKKQFVRKTKRKICCKYSIAGSLWRNHMTVTHNSPDFFQSRQRKVVCSKMKLSFFLFGILCILSPCIQAEHSLSDPLNLHRYGGNLKTASDDYVRGSIWPKPQGQSPTGVVFSLTPKSFTFQINGKTSDVLTQAVQRYKDLTFPDADVRETAPKLDVIESLEVVVVDDYRNMTIESDESCKNFINFLIIYVR